MSNAVFLRPDENGNWGQIGISPTSNMSSQLVFQSGATAIGTGTVHEVGAYSVLTIQTTISATATVAFEASQDGILWVQILSTVPLGGTGASQNTTSSTSVLRFAVSSVKYFRARISAYTSGTVDVIGFASTSGFSPQMVTGTFGNSDSNSATTVSTASGSHNLIYDATGNAWQRVRSVTSGDGIGAGLLATGGYVYESGSQIWNRLRSASNVADGSSGTQYGANAVMAWAGATFDRVRTGKVYKWNEYLGLITTAGTNQNFFTVWSTSSKKLRLMGLSVSVSAANAVLNVRVGPASSGTTITSTRIATLRFATAGNYYIDFGNGYLATNTTDVLEIHNPTTSPTGVTTDVHVTAWGTEE